MVSDKGRLYVALYPSGVQNNPERRYHWGFLLGPKKESQKMVPGKRYHVKNPITPDGRSDWIYEEQEVRNVRSSASLLARLLVAKVEDETRMEEILRSVPIVQNDPNWRCRTWLKDALEAMARDGTAIGTSVLDWTEIEKQGRQYIAEKEAAGRYMNILSPDDPRPTLDLIAGKETVV